MSQIVIRIAIKTFCPPDWRWDSCRQSGETRLGYNLWYVIKGSGSLETPEGRFALGAGDCFLLRSWEEHLGIANPANPPVVAWCCHDHFDQRGRRLPPPMASSLPPRHRRITDTLFFEALMNRMIDAYQAKDTGGDAESWLRSALVEMMRQDRFLTVANESHGGHAETLERLHRRIREKPAGLYRVAALAKEASLCPDHFIRLFKARFGVTPGEHIVASRVDAARGMLLFSNQSVGQIADTLGYPDIYAFSKQFKHVTGKPPTFYRSGANASNAKPAQPASKPNHRHRFPPLLR